ncbi:pseudouridine synthase [Desulfovulcanus sp.]
MNTTFIRLNKFLALAGVCSRRKADELIAQGQVQINGQVITELGKKIDPARDKVTVAGKTISPDQVLNKKFTYVLVNKPIQVVTTLKDPQGRKTIVSLLPNSLQKQRLFPVGRLDYYSQGLIILTNDGELALRMTHPRWEHPKTYQVLVRGKINPRKLDIMAKGMVLREGEKLAPVKVKIIWQKPNLALLQMTLIQGVNRQIRRMCRDLDLTVLKLERTRQGPISLGSLKPGQWRHLHPKEIKALRQSVGLA